MYPSSIFSVTNLRERSISCSRDVHLADYVQLIPLFIAKYFQILIFISKFSKFRFQLFTNYNKIARFTIGELFRRSKNLDAALILTVLQQQRLQFRWKILNSKRRGKKEEDIRIDGCLRGGYRDQWKTSGEKSCAGYVPRARGQPSSRCPEICVTFCGRSCGRRGNTRPRPSSSATARDTRTLSSSIVPLPRQLTLPSFPRLDRPSQFPIR